MKNRFWFMFKVFLLWDPYENYQQIKKCRDQFWLMFKIMFCWEPFLLKEYNCFSPNTERSLEKYNLAFLRKVNNLIATKMYANLLNNHWKIRTLLVQDTIQWLNCVVHYLNMKVKWKLVEKINVKLCSSLK